MCSKFEGMREFYKITKYLGNNFDFSSSQRPVGSMDVGALVINFGWTTKRLPSIYDREHERFSTNEVLANILTRCPQRRD